MNPANNTYALIKEKKTASEKRAKRETWECLEGGTGKGN